MRAQLLVTAALAALVPAAASGEHVRLTLVGGTLGPLPASRGRARSTTPLSDLACLSLPGLRQMAGACGGNDPAQMEGRPQVDPVARVEIGNRVIRSYPIPGTLQPRWEYGVVLDQSLLRASRVVRFMIADYEGPGAERVLGSKEIRVKDLMRPGERTLLLKGPGKAELTYRVDLLPDAEPARRYRFRVPANAQMADLARNARTEGEGYLVIPVAEGETVEVGARGQVRPSARKHPGLVAGPGGIPTIEAKIQYNQPGFRGCPGCNHAALIGQIGSTAMVLGERKRFTVENAGLLVLAINDMKVSDNDGGFDVEVEVALPPESLAPQKIRGGAGDAGPSAIDPRVVQQTVDAHGPELDECSAKEPNPYGDVVLIFSISADGTPLGVIVEKASPNLKRAGECMRQRALRWRFPPPRGVVTARYPISFSPG